jgi:predicted Fe-Mo cluster-binding NifX family protein
LDAPLDRRFGRAPRFLVVNMADGSFESVDNAQNLAAAQGAGIQSARNVAQTGARCVITGHCGPKAFRVLKEAGIQVCTSDAATVAEALALYRKGDLALMESADVEGHWA